MMSLDNIFKAYDIRGQARDLTAVAVGRIGGALGEWLAEAGPVAVGRDMRPDSAKLAAALIKGLRQQGREVWDIGLVTTDMVYFTVGHYKLAGGAMITASHNPAGYNGIKLCGPAAAPIGSASGLEPIRQLAEQFDRPPAPKAGALKHKSVTNPWISHILSFVDTAKLLPFKLGVDVGNGMAGPTVNELAAVTQLKLTQLYFEPDGSFPNHPPDPMNPANLADLVKIVKDQRLDLGVAFDGDGDRAFLVDETGAPVSGSVMSAILAEHFLQAEPGAAIVFDVRTGRAVLDVIQKYEGQPVRSPVGHSFIKGKMRELNAPFGGEASGHFYFRQNWFADSGAIAVMVVLHILSRTGMKLSELAAEYRRYYQSGELNFKISRPAALIAKLAQHYQSGQQDQVDGLTVSFDGWWFNVRPSNTEPLLRLNIEATTKKQLEASVAELTRLIKAGG